MPDIVWEEPPPGNQRPFHNHHLIAAQLRAKKGVWGRVARYKNKRGGYQIARYINNGQSKAYPDGDYEAVYREVDGAHYVYARYLGDGPDE